MTAVPSAVAAGLRFRMIVGDEKALWEAREEIGRGYWECEVIESWDYDGQQAAFHENEILGSLRVDALFSKGYDPAAYDPTGLVGGENHPF
jgi:hypothetical protein